MQFARTIVWLGLALLVTAGCDKKVRITFENRTGEPMDLAVQGPGVGAGPVGKVAPDGGLASVMVAVKKDRLPATYTWSGGGYSGEFVIYPHTYDQLWVRIPGGLSSQDAGGDFTMAEDQLYRYGPPAGSQRFAGLDVPPGSRAVLPSQNAYTVYVPAYIGPTRQMYYQGPVGPPYVRTLHPPHVPHSPYWRHWYHDGHPGGRHGVHSYRKTVIGTGGSIHVGN